MIAGFRQGKDFSHGFDPKAEVQAALADDGATLAPASRPTFAFVLKLHSMS